jgi:hypothetical protein
MTVEIIYIMRSQLVFLQDINIQELVFLQDINIQVEKQSNTFLIHGT